MGTDRRRISAACQHGQATNRSTPNGGRYFVDFAIRSTVARFARGRVRSLGNGLWFVQRLERQREARRNPSSPARELYRRGPDRSAALVRRWHDGPCPSVCCRSGKKRGSEEPADHALGRSRGGFSTKIHLLCDRAGHPLHFHITAGQIHDSTALDTLLEAADAQLRDGQGQPVAWPVQLGGDKGYRADWIDEYLLELGIEPVTPSRHNKDHDRRSLKFDRQAYRQRNIIERLIGWLKESRRIFARFE